MCVCYDVSGHESMAYDWLADATTLFQNKINWKIFRKNRLIRHFSSETIFRWIVDKNFFWKILAILFIFLNTFSKFQVIWFNLQWVMNFFVRSRMLDRRRKSNFLISLASGLASDDSCSPTPKRRQCSHPIANVHARGEFWHFTQKHDVSYSFFIIFALLLKRKL